MSTVIALNTIHGGECKLSLENQCSHPRGVLDATMLVVSTFTALAAIVTMCTIIAKRSPNNSLTHIFKPYST